MQKIAPLLETSWFGVRNSRVSLRSFEILPPDLLRSRNSRAPTNSNCTTSGGGESSENLLTRCIALWCGIWSISAAMCPARIRYDPNLVSKALMNRKVVGLHSGDEEHSEQPLQPPQVHLSSQACVLSSQNELHTSAGGDDGGSMHSVQPPQPGQLHRVSQGCVFAAQNPWHGGGLAGGGGK